MIETEALTEEIVEKKAMADYAQDIENIQKEILACLASKGYANKASSQEVGYVRHLTFSFKKSSFSFSQKKVEIYFHFGQEILSGQFCVHRINLVLRDDFISKLSKDEQIAVKGKLEEIILKFMQDKYKNFDVTSVKHAEIP